MKHFNNPVSIQIPSQEAFERDLRKPLEELGAEFFNSINKTFSFSKTIKSETPARTPVALNCPLL